MIEQIDEENKSSLPYPHEVKETFDDLKYIAAYMRQEDEEKKNKRRMEICCFIVIDRLFLYIFTTANLAGTCGIILQNRENNKFSFSTLKYDLYYSFQLSTWQIKDILS